MVLDPLTHTLFIFGGQRDDKYLSDMYAYDIASNTVSELFGNFSASGGPDACFTQRAVVDAKLREVYVCVDSDPVGFLWGAMHADRDDIGFVG